jgi:hypothetical protein
METMETGVHTEVGWKEEIPASKPSKQEYRAALAVWGLREATQICSFRINSMSK